MHAVEIVLLTFVALVACAMLVGKVVAQRRIRALTRGDFSDVSAPSIEAAPIAGSGGTGKRRRRGPFQHTYDLLVGRTLFR